MLSYITTLAANNNHGSPLPNPGLAQCNTPTAETEGFGATFPMPIDSEHGMRKPDYASPRAASKLDQTDFGIPKIEINGVSALTTDLTVMVCNGYAAGYLVFDTLL